MTRTPAPYTRWRRAEAARATGQQQLIPGNPRLGTTRGNRPTPIPRAASALRTPRRGGFQALTPSAGRVVSSNRSHH